MKNKYIVNNIFNEEGLPFDELITKLISNFLEKDLDLFGEK